MRRTRLITSTSTLKPPPGALLPPPTPRRLPPPPRAVNQDDHTPPLKQPGSPPSIQIFRRLPPRHRPTSCPHRRRNKDAPLDKLQDQDSRLKAQGSRLGTPGLAAQGLARRPHRPLTSLSRLLPCFSLLPTAQTPAPTGRQMKDGRDHGHNERPRDTGLGRLTPLLPLLDGRTRGRTRGRRATPAGRCSGPNTGHRAKTGRIAQTTLDPPRAARDADARRGGRMPGSTIQPPSPHPLPPLLLLLLLDGRTRRPAGRCS